MTEGQATALRAQFARVMAGNRDGEILRFWQSANGELAEALLPDEFRQINDRVVEMGRRNAARELHKWGPQFAAVAEAMEVDLNAASWDEIVRVANILSHFVRSQELRQGSWMLKAVCRQRNAAVARAKANAQEEQKEQEEEALGLLAPHLEVWAALKTDLVSGDDLSVLERLLRDPAQVRPAQRWSTESLKALERCIQASHEDLFEVLVELASEVRKGLAEHRGAAALINGLIARCRGLIAEHREKNRQRKSRRLAEHKLRLSKR